MKKATKLNYKFIHKPYQFCNDPTGSWGQELTFNCEPICKTKKELLQKRAAIVRDIAAVLEKHGITKDEFETYNEFI